uniref:Prohibitin n=1 Tax=Macrostomum lignano TaxID=282301 RepID=A0A1I8IRN2_9PLAT
MSMFNMFKKATAGSGFLAAAAVATYGAYNSFFTVETGHRAILFSRIGGLKDEQLREGLHFRIPWLHRPIIYDIRSKPRQISSPTGSKDLQTVNITLRVLCRPDASDLQNLYRRLGPNYDERVLPSIVNEVLKAVVAKFNASIAANPQELNGTGSRFNVIVDDVSITDLSFSQVYAAAVEAKQIAQQEAQRAQFTQERQQKVVQAEGEAEAARLIGEAVSLNPGYLKLRKIKAAQGIARTLAQSQNRAYLDGSALMMNLQDPAFDERVETGVKKRRLKK